MFSIVQNYLIPSPVIYVLNSAAIKTETNFSEEQRKDVSSEDTIAGTYELPEQNLESAVIEKTSTSKWTNTTYRSDAKWFHCVHCPKKYLHEKAFKRHVLHSHIKEKKFACDECGEKFAWQAYLFRHKKIHYPEFKCEECGRMCPSAKNLRSHMKTHLWSHGSKCDCGCRCVDDDVNEFRTYNCSRCNMQFQNHSSLYRHRKIHATEKCYVCDECRKRFAEAYQLKEHKAHHPISLSYECLECNRRFKTRSSLTIHQHVHNALFVCEECNRTFGTKAYLETHRRAHSDLNKLCVCGQCNINNERINKKKKLVKSRDRGSILPGAKLDKPWVCEICDRQFCHARNMNRHKNSHYKVKQYVCEECDKLFTTLKYLNRHQRKCHI